MVCQSPAPLFLPKVHRCLHHGKVQIRFSPTPDTLRHRRRSSAFPRIPSLGSLPLQLCAEQNGSKQGSNSEHVKMYCQSVLYQWDVKPSTWNKLRTKSHHQRYNYCLGLGHSHAKTTAHWMPLEQTCWHDRCHRGAMRWRICRMSSLVSSSSWSSSSGWRARIGWTATIFPSKTWTFKTWKCGISPSISHLNGEHVGELLDLELPYLKTNPCRGVPYLLTVKARKDQRILQHSTAVLRCLLLLLGRWRLFACKAAHGQTAKIGKCLCDTAETTLIYLIWQAWLGFVLCLETCQSPTSRLSEDTVQRIIVQQHLNDKKEPASCSESQSLERSWTSLKVFDQLFSFDSNQGRRPAARGLSTTWGRPIAEKKDSCTLSIPVPWSKSKHNSSPMSTIWICNIILCMYI